MALHQPAALQRQHPTRLWPVATVATAAAVLTFDHLTEFQIAAAALYVIVVLLAGRFLHPRGVVLVAAGCVALALLNAATTPPIDERALLHGITNISISIAVIVVTAILVVQEQVTSRSLREKGTLLDLTYDAVLACSMDHSITFWNQGAEELYGWTAAEALGKDATEVLHATYPAPLDDLEDELLRVGRWEGEIVANKRDGTRIFVAARWLLQRDDQERPVAILKTNTDITARKQAQESLQQAEANLARLQRVMLVGEMTASIAHEINQPLTGVVANAGTALRWLSAQPPELDEVRQCLVLIQSDGRRASEVIGRIRGLFRRLPPSLGPVDLNETVAEVCALTSSDLQRQAILLRTSLAPDRPVVVADRVQLQQVILNLVVNAVEAMHDLTDRPRQLELSTGRLDAREVFVDVRDSGPGLDAARPDAVFDPFYTTKPGGMGMGLSISRSIVEAHGGHLSAAPNQPHGAMFRFTLPVTPEATRFDPDGTTAHSLHR
jgi:two-component system, LuxR family, sensor kinase FixL